MGCSRLRLCPTSPRRAGRCGQSQHREMGPAVGKVAALNQFPSVNLYLHEQSLPMTDDFQCSSLNLLVSPLMQAEQTQHPQLISAVAGDGFQYFSIPCLFCATPLFDGFGQLPTLISCALCS